MQNNYAKLILYRAVVHISGISEGSFDPSDALRWSRGIELVRESMLYGFGSLTNRLNLIKSDEEIRDVSELMKQFGQIGEGIIPEDYLHGTLRYERVLNIYGATKDDKDKIVSVLADSGLVRDWGEEKFARALGRERFHAHETSKEGLRRSIQDNLSFHAS